jgi:hypothetical protein
MKSNQLKFANPNYQNIRFEIRNKPRSELIGLLLLLSNFLLIVIAIILGIWAVFRRLGAAPAMILSAITSVCSVYLMRLSQRYLSRPGAALITDARPPVLYLRSFQRDIEIDGDRKDKMTPEEIIASVFNQIGPLITVGNPLETEDTLPYLGATRIYLTDDWPTNVLKLMTISRAIIINADWTDSVLWELKTARRQVHYKRLFISFLPVHGTRLHAYVYQQFAPQFKKIFAAEIPEYNEDLCFIDFDSYEKPNAISLKSEYRFTKAVRPFMRSNKSHQLCLETAQQQLNYIFWMKGLFSSVDQPSTVGKSKHYS